MCKTNTRFHDWQANYKDQVAGVTVSTKPFTSATTQRQGAKNGLPAKHYVTSGQQFTEARTYVGTVATPFRP